MTSTTRTTTLSLRARLAACVLAFALVCSGAAWPYGQAYADVRKADIIYGETADSRGLTVSQCPSIDAEYAIVMSSDGTVYFERNADEATQIASITKIMTAVVALDAVAAGTVSLESEVAVSDEAAEVGESSAGLESGDTMDMETALKALLIPSGNDAAIAIADTVGQALLDAGAASGDSAEEAFVAAMNEKASALGCTNTLYENSHGLDYDEYAGDMHSSARDQALVVQYAMTNETFRSIVALGDTSITVSRGGAQVSIDLETTDEFADLYEYAIGVKTGYTALAGSSFAGASSMDGVELYAIVLDSTDDTQRFYDAQTLCEWTYEHLVSYQLANSSETSEMDGTEVPVVAEVAHNDWVDTTVKATLSDPSAVAKVFDLNGNISQTVDYETVTGDVKAGDKVGTITFKQRNQVVATVDLVACEDVAAPNIIEGIGVWWDKLIRSFTGQQTVAQSVVLNETPLINDKTSS